MFKENKIQYFLSCVFLSLILSVQGQDKILYAEQFTSKEGLSNNYTMQILQDKRGFIWVSTADGLNRYDGYTFTKFLHTSKQGSPPNNAVRQMKADAHGTLWFITDAGPAYYEEETETFHCFYQNIGPIKVTSDWSGVIFFPDKAGNIWFHWNTELYFVNTRDSIYEKIPAEKMDGSIIRAGSMTEDHFRNLWLNANNELLVISAKNRNSKQFTRIKTDSQPDGLHQGEIRNLISDQHEKVWFWNDGLCRIRSFNDNKIEVDRVAISLLHQNEVADINKDSRNNIWVLFQDGFLNEYNPSDKSIRSYQIVIRNQQTKALNYRSVFIDKSDIIWITTNSSLGGVVKVNVRKNQFNLYSHNGEINSVNGILMDSQGLLWVGSMSTPLKRYDRNKDQLSVIHAGYGSSNLDVSVAPMMEDKDNTLWLGSYTILKVLTENRRNNYIETLRYVPIDGDTTSVQAWSARCFFQDRMGNIWYGNSSLVNMLPYSEIRKARPRFRHCNTIMETWCISDDYTGTIWVGANKGLHRLDTGMIVKKLYLYNQDDSTTIGANNIKCIYESSNRQLWIGTEGGGLNLYDREHDCFIRYIEKDGLPNNVVWGILEDNHGNLWMSTNKGISKFDPQKKTFKNYDEGDGLQGTQFNLGAFHKSKNGEMFFGGVNGINSFYPDSLKDNQFIPPVVITKFLIYNHEIPIGEQYNGKVILNKSISLTSELVLSYKDNSFSFEFAALDYTTPEKNQYAYMMEGFDNDWIPTNALRRFVTYTNLDPGQYTFKVKGTNSDGVWNEKGTSIIIVQILPPFWKTWWFRILMFLLLVFSIAGAFVGRIRQMAHQKKKLQKLVDEQTLEIRQQSEVLKEVNLQLVEQQNDLQETNVLLEERQQEILAQKEELEHQADELGKANATKDKFFSIIGHDLKNPMYAINSLSKMLKENCRSFPVEQIEEMSGMLEQSSGGVTALLENLLTWARSQSGKMDFRPETIDLYEISRDTIQILKMNAENKGLSLINEISKDTRVYADKNMITTVIRNLVNNSIKFTPSGSITLQCRMDNGMWNILVVDTGIGMSEEVRNKLFRIDVHHTSQGTSGEAGTGLGLIICKEFVEQNGGQIWVESEYGKGSAFIFSLKPMDSY